MSPEHIIDALTTIVTAAIGYGAIRHELRAIRHDLLELKKAKQREHDEFRERLKKLEHAA